MPELFRKRLIPNECIALKKDIILYQDDSIILTSWDTLKPKATLARGYSLYILDKGYKISRFIDANDNFICWYCDIIRHEYDSIKDCYIFIDLLADVLLYEDGTLKMPDGKIITPKTPYDAKQIYRQDAVFKERLKEIYSNSVEKMQKKISKVNPPKADVVPNRPLAVQSESSIGHISRRRSSY